MTGLFQGRQLAAQEVKIWEFAPYDVEVWYALDPSVQVSETGQKVFVEQLQADLKRTFRAAWKLQFSKMQPELTGTVVRRFDNFTVTDLTTNEWIMVASKTNEQTKNVRSFEAALDTITTVAVPPAALEQLQTAAQRLGLDEASPTRKLIAKCVVDEGAMESIHSRLADGSLACALIPRSELASVGEDIRPVVTMLPWQTDSIFRQRDKLFFLHVSQQAEDFVVRVRELDCPMQFAGPAFEVQTSDWSQMSRLATHAFTRAFAPIARVEDAEAKTAKLRLRAGGLILEPTNPANLSVGDVLQPIVRRDDRNGVPTLLEPLSWTFAAITASDGVKMDANVYTYSGGPGLQGRQNRRTQRILLKVRPRFEQTDIKIAVRGKTGQPQSGCFVFKRDLLTDEFELLGRTDWRGRFTVPVPEFNGSFLSEEVRRTRFQAKKAAEEAAAAAKSAEDNASDSSDNATPGPSADDVVETELGEELPLKFPLLQIYIKSGDTVLAKLPMVPGLKKVEIAELPDDGRRLQAEAFVRGFQGEILDTIGLRNLLAARIQLYLKEARNEPSEREKTLEQANAVLEEFRKMPTYNEMADKLEKIQRAMLDETQGPISLSAKNRIDRMFQTTRDMLQKYLQDTLLSDSEQAVRSAMQGTQLASPDVGT